MKALNLIILVVLFSGFNSFAQQMTFETIEAATKRPKGKFTSYKSANGEVYKVGDKITLGAASSDKEFTFVTSGDGLLLPIEPLEAKAAGQKLEIKKMWCAGSKKTGYYMQIITKAELTVYNIDIEKAISHGEVKGYGMSSDEALKALKTAKDKLDLGLMDEAKYELIKAELIKYIK